MKVIDGIEMLNDGELTVEHDLVVALEKLLDQFWIKQEDLSDGWVIHTADTLLRAHDKFGDES